MFLLEHKLQKIECNKRTDQNRQIEIQNHDQCKDHRIEDSLLLSDESLCSER